MNDSSPKATEQPVAPISAAPKRPAASDAARSELMKRVRQAGTAPEQMVRRLLGRVGARYRLNSRGLPGRPDIANRTRRKAIFVHGCFWHHHEGCPRGRIPKSNREFWTEKLRSNVKRDQMKVRALEDMGFDVLVLWECELTDAAAVVDRLRAFWFPPAIGCLVDYAVEE
jgi:DNA mismatch endonuclease, patch repair protein